MSVLVGTPPDDRLAGRSNDALRGNDTAATSGSIINLGCFVGPCTSASIALGVAPSSWRSQWREGSGRQAHTPSRSLFSAANHFP